MPFASYHNQTNIDYMQEKYLAHNGTGIFLVPTPDKPGRAKRVVFVDDVSYDECFERGTHCVSFKWVPASIATYDQIRTMDPGGCPKLTCRRNQDCPFPCFCNNGICADR